MQEAGTKETENTYRIAVGKPEWKKQLERKIYIERKVILKQILKKQDEVMRTEFT